MQVNDPQHHVINPVQQSIAERRSGKRVQTVILMKQQIRTVIEIFPLLFRSQFRFRRHRLVRFEIRIRLHQSRKCELPCGGGGGAETFRQLVQVFQPFIKTTALLQNFTDFRPLPDSRNPLQRQFGDRMRAMQGTDAPAQTGWNISVITEIRGGGNLRGGPDDSLKRSLALLVFLCLHERQHQRIRRIEIRHCYPVGNGLVYGEQLINAVVSMLFNCHNGILRSS